MYCYVYIHICVYIVAYQQNYCVACSMHCQIASVLAVKECRWQVRVAHIHSHMFACLPASVSLAACNMRWSVCNTCIFIYICVWNFYVCVHVNFFMCVCELFMCMCVCVKWRRPHADANHFSSIATKYSKYPFTCNLFLFSPMLTHTHTLTHVQTNAWYSS